MRKFFDLGIDVATLIVICKFIHTAIKERNDEFGEMATFALVVMSINMILRFIF